MLRPGVRHQPPKRRVSNWHLGRCSGLPGSGCRLVRVLAWYDNEWGFSKRLLERGL